MRGRSGSAHDTELRNFFVNELEKLLWSEKEYIEILPEVIEASQDSFLKNVYQRQLIESHTQITRLKQLFSDIGIEPNDHECEAMAGILEKADKLITGAQNGDLRYDLTLVFVGRTITHYKIAAYGSLLGVANTLFQHDLAGALKLTLKEKEFIDTRLINAAVNIEDVLHVRTTDNQQYDH